MELNEDELQALKQYMSSKSYIINEKLRLNDDDLTLRERNIIVHLDNALKKLPFYNGDITRSVYLRRDQVQEFLEEHKIGNTIIYGAYTSFTSGDEYNPEAIIQMLILDSTKARDITKYNADEKEVLYERNTKFQVEYVEHINDIYYIFLMEV